MAQIPQKQPAQNNTQQPVQANQRKMAQPVQNMPGNVVQQPIQQATQMQPDGSQPQEVEGGNSKWWIWVIVGVVVIGVLAAVYFLVF